MTHTPENYDKVTLLHLAITSAPVGALRTALLTYAFIAAFLNLSILFLLRLFRSTLPGLALGAATLWSFFAVLYFLMEGLIGVYDEGSTTPVLVPWGITLTLMMADMMRPFALLDLCNALTIGHEVGNRWSGAFTGSLITTGFLGFVLLPLNIINASFSSTLMSGVLGLGVTKCFAAILNLRFYRMACDSGIRVGPTLRRISNMLLAILSFVTITLILEIPAVVTISNSTTANGATLLGIAYGLRVVYLTLMLLVVRDIANLPQPSRANERRASATAVSVSVVVETRATYSPSGVRNSQRDTYPEAPPRYEEALSEFAEPPPNPFAEVS